MDISSCLDLTEQSGCITLTSPKLFKTRLRTFLLHIKSVSRKDDKPKPTTSAAKPKTFGGVATKSPPPSSTPNRKAEFYMGCDCLHEVSITVYTTKHTYVLQKRGQRSAMLESNTLVQSLLLTASIPSSYVQQSMALDVLVWIAAIRLTRNRSFNGQPPNHQFEFLNVVQGNLQELLRQCMLYANRSLARKCAKLMIICSRLVLQLMLIQLQWTLWSKYSYVYISWL